MTGVRPQSTPDAHARRQLLAVTAVPATSLASVTTLSVSLSDDVTLKISYVADRVAVTETGFVAYAAVWNADLVDDVSLESLAARMAEDFSNELVPKWMHVTLARNAASQGKASHTVTVEDRQPGWDRPSLLRDLAK